METNQQQQFQQPQQPCPENYLVWAILCTVLCCLPLGIVSIIKSTSVEKLWLQGRYEEAQRASNSAKQFAIWGAAASLIIWVIYIILFALGVFARLFA